MSIYAQAGGFLRPILSEFSTLVVGLRVVQSLVWWLFMQALACPIVTCDDRVSEVLK